MLNFIDERRRVPSVKMHSTAMLLLYVWIITQVHIKLAFYEKKNVILQCDFINKTILKNRINT